MEKKVVEPKNVCTTRLVKSEDLNHHKTLFAGRTAEWFVEAGFIAAAKLVDPSGVVCLKIHGMYFTQPVKSGQILDFTSKIVYTGKSSLVSYIQVSKNGSPDTFVSGFITFIFVDENTKPTPHHVEIKPVTAEDIELQEKAKRLRK
ncbi:MAG: hotdog domain-containing protein [Bacteroidota bacterium]